ncbi:hypothetical protein UCRPA7_8321 [Phaeoacremonium minimum UCRPA7]|uniref:Uncharacterized protein n=1 Tax=Phaeoacremonium minimum (strain UCR-PA7) TaxID=1286976 RepID=R8BA77_PHAM7|nr:hypothetical protein UCRPA7_8321 [Phaeoacremonium minimum UCRPA7]EON96186.1 hypothetical protein UCRPA7_8321 [Phaeoacremonium minimum UCRPA7]
MLDENLPSFLFKQSSDNPLSSVIYFTQNGSDPEPEYVFKRADAATNPAARNKYAIAITDPYAPDVVYGEVVVEPQWQQPTLSAAEIRAQSGPVTPIPIVPDSFVIQLYNPDQSIAVKMVPGSFTKMDSWDFEMPTQTFKMPSASQLDRQNNEPVVGLRPKVMFKWRKDGRLSKDMTCYNVGRSLGKHKSKDPDITVALFKQARESAVTIYEPNLQRVEVEDRKGLDIVLILGAEVIRELYLAPRQGQDIFNLSAGTITATNGKRKNSRPTPPPAAGMAMSGALGNNIPPPQSRPGPPTMTSASNIGSSATPAAANTAEIEAETKRLQAMVEKEQREREKRDRDEQKRIKKMLEEEDKERRRREAEVARETERLRKMYGTQGQDLPSQSPPLPPRPTFGAPPPAPAQQQGGGGGGWFAPPPQPPPRPLSAGPAPGPGAFHNSSLGSWWRGPSASVPQQQPPPPPQNARPSGPTLQTPYGGNPSASVSGFFHRNRDEERRKVQKKRSVQW